MFYTFQSIARKFFRFFYATILASWTQFGLFQTIIAFHMDPSCVNLHIRGAQKNYEQYFGSYRTFSHITHFWTHFGTTTHWGQRIFRGMWKCTKWIQLGKKCGVGKEMSVLWPILWKLEAIYPYYPFLDPFWHPQGPNRGVTYSLRYLKVPKMNPAGRKMVR